jgi:hypothetical protein
LPATTLIGARAPEEYSRTRLEKPLFLLVWSFSLTKHAQPRQNLEQGKTSKERECSRLEASLEECRRVIETSNSKLSETSAILSQKIEQLRTLNTEKEQAMVDQIRNLQENMISQTA